MATKALTIEETNYLRAVYLCYRVAPAAVRTSFDNQHPSHNLVSNLTAEKSNLQKIKGKILQQFHWDKLFPSAGSPSPVSTDFDVTLLICLLRSMKPKIAPPPFGFDALPHISHTTDGAHVARIKYYRNRLAHSTDGKLSSTEFVNLWKDLEVAIKGLGGSQFGQEINNAKTISLENTLAETLRQLTEYEKRYDDLSDELNNAMDTLRTEQAAIRQDNEQRAADMVETVNVLEGKMSELSTSMQDYFSDIPEIKKDDAEMKMETVPKTPVDVYIFIMPH